MALIIKGGETPVDCLGCDEMVMLSQCPIHLNEPLKYCDGTRHPDCPIIGEIPDKHGDLIDRQAVLSYFETAFLMGADMDYEDIVGIVSNPKAIPTILEATE